MRTVFVTQDVAANALALCPDFSQVVIAGRHVFKIFSLEEDSLVERVNLRQGKYLNSNFSCNDVVWNPIDDSILATAATNGAVVTWNLSKPSRSKQDCMFNDHKRTVHKVNFHPTEYHLLISGSQDGFMKLFDLRKKETASTFNSNAESVRDVQFNPHFSPSFCAVSENGNVQLWDMRKSDRAERQFTAHGGPVFALDWHPEVKTWIATAGRDKTIKVWDLNDVQTARHTIQTIAPVGRIKWRPHKKHHIASCALILDCSINVWDIRRPYIPFAAFNEHKNLTSGIVWTGDSNSFLSVGKDCKLYHHNFEDATHPIDKANPVALDMSIYGNVSVANRIKDGSETIGSVPKLPLFRPDQHIPRNGSTHSLSMMSSLNWKTSTVMEPFGQVLSLVQILYSGDVSILSTQHMVESAKRYLLTGRSLSEICEHNAQVASDLKRQQVAHTWQMLQIMYAGSSSSNTDHMQVHILPSREDPATQPDSVTENDQRSSRHYSGDGGDTSVGGFSGEEGETETDETDTHDRKLANIASGLTISQDFYFGDGEISQMPFDYEHLPSLDTSQDWTLPTEAFQPRHQILHRSATPPPELQNKCSPRETHDSGGGSGYVVEAPSALRNVASININNWGCTQAVLDVLHHYAASGDVQMAVTCIIVLGEKLKGHLDEAVVEHWFLSYIDMLHRYRLWNVATQVIQFARIPNVHQLNQQSTTVYLHCGQCGHSLSSPSSRCSKCGLNASLCAVCHNSVHGLYLWCQGCTHGGHAQHMQEWRSVSKECPAGCGHVCEYT